MPDVQHLLLRNHRIRHGFNVTLTDIAGRRGFQVLPHTHDFGELMFVVEGTGHHVVNDVVETLVAGDLLWIRQQDVHWFRVGALDRLRFINVAFEQHHWLELGQLCGHAAQLETWQAAPFPRAVRLEGRDRQGCVRVFERALQRFVDGPTRLDLVRLQADALGFLADAATVRTWPANAAGSSAGPEWLQLACERMREPENLRHGLPRLLEMCPVSRAHLCRTFMKYHGQTPTAFLAGLRVNHAARLLLTTTRGIADIADACGFQSLSNFYARFTAATRETPRSYRLNAQRVVGGR